VTSVTFTLLPAVDVADGQAVRLVQGEAGTETTSDRHTKAIAWAIPSDKRSDRSPGFG
jgi:phosphoribosylformimino-5-aminoimidazole carboxamide ribonucleotide (ProFAR) isomerase